MPPHQLNPARLPLGTRVGSWRVLERLGRGANGAVYRAIGSGEVQGPVALKLALHPDDERFSREVELLSRIRHPNVPHLVGHGVWQQPQGAGYPYLVMEFIDGVSLYEWASMRAPSSRHVLRVLARIARALEATHAAAGVHRDVKGVNVLVSELEGRVFLTDFGSGHYRGAAPLTQPPFPPGTLPYRSPEAWRSVRLPLQAPVVPYAPGPADDVYALGVTAFRLVTGEYPFQEDPATGSWHHVDTAAPSARALNPRCCEALEQAAREAGPEADVPLFAREAPPREETSAAPPRVVRPAPERFWLAAASVGGALALGGAWWLGAHSDVEDSAMVHASAREEAKDGGTVAVGDSVLTAPVAPDRAPFPGAPLAVEVPPKPFPGQRRPDANGRCLRSQVPIHGGCWIKLTVDLKDCGEDNTYVYKGACYTPAFPPARPPTSSPTERADDAQ